MKRHNHETDLELYRLIFEVYFCLIDELVKRTDFELEDLKDEKKLCRPKRSGNLPKEFLAACDDSFIQKFVKPEQQITINADGFTCSFRLYEVITYKRLIERKLVTPKHHRYYVDVINESKKVA